MPIPWYCQENLHKCKKGKYSLFPGTREFTYYRYIFMSFSACTVSHFFYCDILVEFGVHLAELTVDRTGALAIRQVSYFIPFIKVAFY